MQSDVIELNSTDMV